jgi:hypothetical protein
LATKATCEAQQLLKESLSELESSKGSILSGVQKLSRAAKILENEKVIIWCDIQLGDLKYTIPLKKYLSGLLNKKETKESEESLPARVKELKQLNLSMDDHCSLDELNVKAAESGGGYINVGFIEEKYADLVRRKQGNDGTYYKNNLSSHLNYIRKAAHDRATLLYNSIAFSDVPQTTFDILKIEVEDKLLDLHPELAEKLMTAFKAVSGNNSEEWSHSLTTCRRFIENLADVLYPATDQVVNGRGLKQQNYINRIWAYMDSAIESESNRDLAKAHVDLLGNYLQRLFKISNKGVHTELLRLEAVKAVFHTYLLVADILIYMGKDITCINQKGANIHTATLDDIQCSLNISKTAAKEIIKLRVIKGSLQPDNLLQIRGIGPKSFEIAKQIFSFESTN